MPAYAILLALAHMLPLSGGAQAVTSDPLQGLKSVNVMVAPLDSDASLCNVDRESLNLSAMRPLLDGKIRVDPSAVTNVFVGVTVMPLNTGGCAASVNVSAHSPAVGILGYRADDKAVSAIDALLWSEGTLLTGTSSNFGQRVNTSVRQFVDDFVTKIKLANQK